MWKRPHTGTAWRRRRRRRGPLQWKAHQSNADTITGERRQVTPRPFTKEGGVGGCDGHWWCSNTHSTSLLATLRLASFLYISPHLSLPRSLISFAVHHIQLLYITLDYFLQCLFVLACYINRLFHRLWVTVTAGGHFLVPQPTGLNPYAAISWRLFGVKLFLVCI